MSSLFPAAVALGILATALLDLWCFARERFFAVPAPAYAPVGRWVAHLARGCFFHNTIAATPKVKGELLLGWLVHYAVGIAFAAILLAAAGPAWLQHPTFVPALAVGLISVAAPFLLLQPGMGFGIASSRAPDPRAARLRSLTLHAVFGVALYLAGWMLASIQSGAK